MSKSSSPDPHAHAAGHGHGHAATSHAAASSAVMACPCISDKSKTPMKAVMTPLVITEPAPKGILLQLVDANMVPVPIGPNDNVAGTLTSDSQFFVIAPGEDSLHYTASIPPDTPFGTVVHLAATASGTVQGAPFNGTASIEITINLPPQPVATDLTIVIS
jgi:hypothetical protein